MAHSKAHADLEREGEEKRGLIFWIEHGARWLGIHSQADDLLPAFSDHLLCHIRPHLAQRGTKSIPIFFPTR